MPFHIRYHSRNLQFKFDARTSRGSLTAHKAYYLVLSHTENEELSGWGEAAPLAGLSPDYRPDFEEKLVWLCNTFNAQNHTDLEEINHWFSKQELAGFPSLQFALETALLDYTNGGKRIIFESAFTHGEKGIPINGLVWMGNENFMREQIGQKLAQGYNCLKLKIGGLDFDTELAILRSIREMASADELVIRLDANGAFSPQNALEKLDKLAAFQIHSLEQPIKAGQPESMQKICAESPVAIALDEELIGLRQPEAQQQLLEQIQPQYIILKPTLIGGLESGKNWIRLAEQYNTGWWITSALESNIGLNAIAQFTATFGDLIPQGLGTGQLYHNNIVSPLFIEKGFLYYKQNQGWAPEI